MTVLTHKGYRLLKSELSDKQQKNIKNDLTVTPKTLNTINANKDDDNSFAIFAETEKYLYVPRYYGIEKFGKPEEDTFDPSESKMQFTGKLREYQEPIVEKCLQGIRKTGGGLLCVPCGCGKTTMALYMAVQLGLKTLVVVHKSFLMEQWIERIKMFTTATIGKIQQNTVKMGDIVVAMIQTISKRDYEYYSRFGFVIYDECHHVAARVFSQTLVKTGCRYTLGLSATPKRIDGLTKVIHWYIGPTLYEIKLKTNNQTIVKMFTYHSNGSLFKNYRRYYAGEMRPDCVTTISALIQLPQRNKHIVNIIAELVRDPLRKILVLSGRKSHLAELKTALDDKLQELDISQEDCRTCFYHGDLSSEEREYSAKNGDVIFGTYDMAQEGLDIERLNTIVFATPKKNIVQAVGRVMRKVLEDGDIRPMVVDIRDNLDICMRHSQEREKYYKQSKYKIEHAYLKNNNIISPNDFAEINGKARCFTDVYKDSIHDILECDRIQIVAEN